MAIKMVVLLPLSLLLLLLSSLSSAHNITAILESASDNQYSTFNSLLTQTNLAVSINRRKTITVLAVDNSAAGAFSGLDNTTLRSLLAVHVILDYYDSMKLGKLQGSVLLTTLYQASGVAQDRMGFVNMTKFNAQHRIALRSAVHGAPFTSDIVGPVMSNPYNISVLHVSSAILTRDIYNMNFTVAPPPPKAAAEPPAPAGSPPAPAPAADANATAPGAGAADAPAPAADAPAPVADAPSPDGGSSPEPDDDVVDDADTSMSSAVCAGFGVTMFAVLMGL